MSYNYYSEEEDYNKKESINNYWQLFSKYEKEEPSLSDALNQMFISANIDNNKINELTKEIMRKCKLIYEQNHEEIYNNYETIIKEDVYIISTFTIELNDYEYSPFIILHKNLVAENRKQGLENISKYLYIFLKSLRKLPIFHFKQELYKFIQKRIKIEEDNINKNIIPYKSGITKTFFGFSSINLSPNIEYGDIKDNRQGTLFIIKGDTWGYDISLFNYFGKKKYLLEPEKIYIFDKILANFNNIIIASCTIVKSPIIFENIQIEGVDEFNKNEIELEPDDINSNSNFVYETYYPKINKYVCKIKIELKEREETMISIGVLCNIPQKKLKALITYNHAIDLDYLVNEKILIISIEGKIIEINMKKTRYMYTNEKSDITIIEILDEDNIKDFIELDESIETKEYINEDILSIGFKDEDDDDEEENNMENKNIEVLDDKIIAKGTYKNKYYTQCSKENLCEGIIVLKNNLKIIGLIMENIYQKNIEFLPMKKIMKEINFIKCKYLVTKDNLEKEIQIYTNEKENIITKGVKIIANGELKSNTDKYKFSKEGLHNVYIVCYKSFNIYAMFKNCFYLKEIDFSSFTYIQSDLSYLFSGCVSLDKLDLSSFTNYSIELMHYMFHYCISIKEIDLSNLATDKVLYMHNMFEGCENLEKINLSSFKTEKVKNMSDMFSKCSLLKELDLSSFNTNNVEDMNSMFNECVSLESINFSSLFKTNQVKNFCDMFHNCSSLKKINLSSFNTDNAHNMSRMFSNCSSLEEINLSSFNTHMVKDMAFMFNNCHLLKKLNISTLNTSEVINMSFMFNNCCSLKELDLSSFNTNKVENMLSMFDQCSSLIELNLSSFNTENVTDMSSMFNECSSLKSLNIPNFNTINVKTISRMFSLCSSLEQMNLSAFNTKNVIKMNLLFNECKSLKKIDLSSFDTTNVTDMSLMFYNCSSIQQIDISSFNTNQLTNMTSMFAHCSSLEKIVLPSFEINQVTNMSYMFSNCSLLKEINFSNFCTNKVVNMSNLFYNCSSLEKIDLSSFDTSCVTSMDYMFYKCTSMFSSCSNLKELDLSSFKTNQLIYI